MAKKLSSDATLFVVTAALLGLGLVMVWSASSMVAQESHGNPYHFLIKQALWACLGLMVMVVAMRTDYRRLRQPAVVYSAVAATALLLIVVLFMPVVNESHRWFRMAGLSFQPAEPAKITVILFLAYHLERKAGRVNDFFVVLFPALLLMGWFAFLIYNQPDLGSAAMLVLIGGVMLYLAGVRMRYFATMAIFLLPLLYHGVMSAAYRRGRIETFLNPWQDARGAGYQIIQSLIAVGSGGLTGVGLMEGRQKLFYLPYPYNDFIFSVIGEELGLAGCLAVLAGFMLFLWRGVRASWKAPDAFGMYLAAGLTFAVVLQALINMSVVIGLLPTKGIALPLISAGGSSLVITLFAVGLVLNVSQQGS